MNLSMVVIGHLTNPFDLNGSFSVHFSAEDFTANGFIGKASSRGFNLSVDTGGARPLAVPSVVVRLADGLRIEGFADCPARTRNFMSGTAHFSGPGRVEPVGRFDSYLHWDGNLGILTAHWVVPRR